MSKSTTLPVICVLCTGKEQLRNADGSGVSVTGGTGQRQSMQQRRGAGGQVLDSQDWPTLGRPPKELEVNKP